MGVVAFDPLDGTTRLYMEDASGQDQSSKRLIKQPARLGHQVLELTQHRQHVLQDRSELVIFNKDEGELNMDDIVRLNELLGNLLENVEVIECHVRGQPFFRWGLRDIEVEAVEICCGMDVSCHLQEPDPGLSVL